MPDGGYDVTTPGIAALGIAALGIAALGIAALGIAALGIAALGIAALGIAEAERASEPTEKRTFSGPRTQRRGTETQRRRERDFVSGSEIRNQPFCLCASASL